MLQLLSELRKLTTLNLLNLPTQNLSTRSKVFLGSLTNLAEVEMLLVLAILSHDGLQLRWLQEPERWKRLRLATLNSENKMVKNSQ